MYKRIAITFLMMFLLCGCGKSEGIMPPEEPKETASQVNSEQIIATDMEAAALELKACYGTITKISDGKVYILGVNDVLYVGNTELLGNLKENDFVYLEYSTGEMKDDVYEVEFTTLKLDDNDIESRILGN